MPDARAAPALLHGSYTPSDVTFLLKPVAMAFCAVDEKETLIQSGRRHYSEMLSPESAPSAAYMDIYFDTLAHNGVKVAQHVNILADVLAARTIGPRGLALASLARAGTPVGVLLTRALRRRGVAVAHYSVSIIRDRGVDGNALRYILDRHDPADVVFVDGWTGKGAIAAELRGPRGSAAFGIAPCLAVLADPAGRADLAATFEDYVIPSGILNGIVSGLLSRSVLNAQIGPDDFHGCVRLDHLQAHDLSRAFVETIDALAVEAGSVAAPSQTSHAWFAERAEDQRQACDNLVARLAADAGIHDLNRIKPGIAEATRAVLRRMPDKLLLSEPTDSNVRHLVYLARERNICVEPLPDGSIYRAAAVIATVGGD